MLHENVLKFIKSFSDFGPQVTECFTCGRCYWFASILADRFHGDIYYDVVANHFGCNIDGHIYDITGDVTHQYNWVDWFYVRFNYDELVIERIYRDCIN